MQFETDRRRRPECLLTRWSVLTIASASLALILGLSGCTGGSKGGDAKNTLRFSITLEPSSMDPAKILDVGIASVLQNTYEGLIALDEKNRIVPLLAKSWDVSSDKKTYTFHLQPNAKFHNGRAVNAQDVKYTIERALWPDTKSPTASSYLAGIDGVQDVIKGKRNDLPSVKVIDDHTISITLDKPRGYFLGALSMSPAWVVCKEAIEKNNNVLDERAAIGTGAYKITEYRHNSKVIMEAFNDYWGGKPAIAKVEWPIVLDPNTSHIMYEKGDLDVTNPSLRDYTKTDLPDPVRRKEAFILPQASLFFITMHYKLEPAFANKKVRRAIAMAIDRDEIVRVATLGNYPRADSFLPPGLPGSDPNIRKIPFDPAGAAKLLAEAGYPGGKGFPTLQLCFIQKGQALANTAAIVRENLKNNLGIKVDLQEREGAGFFEDTSHYEKIAFYISGWVADYIDAQDFLSTLLRSGAPYNHYGYKNAEFDKLCDRADGEIDMDKRIPDYMKADQICMDDVAVLPLYFSGRPTLVKSYVKNFKANLVNYLPVKTFRLER